MRGAHNELGSYAAVLRNTARVVLTPEVRERYDSLVAIRDGMNAYKTDHATYFQATYPNEAAAANGLISSLDNILGVIASLRNNYMSGGKFTDEQVSQADKDTLATAIEAELEAVP